MLDERSASWKVLLSYQPEHRVLALELNVLQVASLARSLGRIFWNIPKDTKLELRNIPTDIINRITVVNKDETKNHTYNIIIAGGTEAPSLEEFANLLVEDGTLVCIGFMGLKLGKPKLLSMGFNSIDMYGALPLNQPRIFYPLADRRLRHLGLGFHKPGSMKAKFGVQTARILNNLGIKFPLEKGAVTLARRRKSIEGTLLEWLGKKLDQDLVDLVIYCGSDSERRKITALAIDEDGTDCIVKIADTLKGSAAIAQETAVLLAISESDLPAIFPEIILEEKWNNYSIQVQTNVSIMGARQVPQLTDTHLKLLAALSNINRQGCKLAATQLWQETIVSLSKGSGRLPWSLTILANEVSTSSYGEEKIICHSTHGDFAPWNIDILNGKIAIWDWEDSLESGLIYSDIFHFIVRQAILIGPWPGSQRIINRIATASQRLSTLTHTPDALDPLNLLKFWVVREYLKKPSEHLEEIASELGGGVHS